MPYELLVAEPALIKTIKTSLENDNLFVKPITKENQFTVIRTNISDSKEIESRFPNIISRQYEYKSTNLSMVRDIIGFSRNYFQSYITDESILQTLLDHIPTRYSIYPPLLLFNNSSMKCFTNDIFINIISQYKIDLSKYYHSLLSDFIPVTGMTVVAINKPILEEDTMRQPHNLEILYKDTDMDDEEIWCQLKQNDIWQVWNPMYTMFSRGNIKEKKRVLDTFKDVRDNDIVDLYCGIGYFSFSYLKLGCRNIFGFELNPWSITGFWKGYDLNHGFGHSNRSNCHIYNENNEMSLQRIKEYRDTLPNHDLLRIRHINLGLLPSSEQGWPIAIRILSEHNDWLQCPLVTLHIHENVSIEDINSGKFINQTLTKLGKISTELNNNNDHNHSYKFEVIHLEKIKTFAPDIWHICLDVNVTNII